MAKINDLTEKTTAIATWDKVLIIDSEDSDTTKIAPASNFVWPKGDTWDTWPAWPAGAYGLLEANSVLQSIPDSTETKITFDVEYNSGSGITSLTNNRITAPTTAMYLVTAYGRRSTWFSNETHIGIYKNWTGAINSMYAAYIQWWTSIWDTRLQLSFPAYLTAWDYIELYLTHSEWANRTLLKANLSLLQIW